MTPDERLVDALQAAEVNVKTSFVDDGSIQRRIDYICRCTSNRAGVRLLLSCVLAKLDNPSIDPRKPYTEIGGNDSFSGRTYDERYIGKFITEHRLPVSTTTAFLTPTFRNIDQPLTKDRGLVGRPRDLYKYTLELLEDLAEGRVSAESVLKETFRILVEIRDERLARIDSLKNALQSCTSDLPLSSEAIVTLTKQHLECKNASRLPVLIVAAAYTAAGDCLNEKILQLKRHNAADLQTGSSGDVEICLINDEKVVTVYEMKMKRVHQKDIDAALAKILKAANHIDNYLFITTDPVDDIVVEYASSLYEETNGTEIAILDCLGFLRHFLHLFYRKRDEYLNAYQELVLNEPDSAVSQALKEAFLTLRNSAQGIE